MGECLNGEHFLTLTTSRHHQIGRESPLILEACVESTFQMLKGCMDMDDCTHSGFFG